MLNLQFTPGTMVEIAQSAIDIETHKENALIAANLNLLELNALNNVFQTVRHNKIKSDRVVIVLKSEFPHDPAKTAIVKMG
ncbi:MAG: hypothetical protein J7647_05060 [Cyanobacteria bacterium SBLK]|nr:hypothetical protein [Cyanobacteria bacterium SBLK]